MIRSLKHTALALAIGATVALSAHAAAPMQKTNAPGFARIMLGEFEITPLSDGTADLPMDQLLQQKPEATRATLEKNFLKLPLETSTNAFLVNTGSKLILIDTGSGNFFGPTLGKLTANLKAAGYQPEQVDEIFITHMHPDHVGGLASDGKRVFPNAIVRAARSDSDYWLSQANADRAPADKKGFFQPAMVSLKPYVDAGKFQPITADGELVPGITALSAPGHTPGHTVYLVQSGGQKLLVIGDLIHVARVQMDKPQVTIGFDSDAKAAYASRKKFFDAAAKDGELVAGAHLQFPGLGHLVIHGTGYDWIPVNYTQLR
jgi:glyoxylase-like metal-dependent hydrolase (beta-lactamase superfamily II)